ncbi:MAG: cobyrinate a,c-diamide synthase [Paracoccaceae bacterium]
MARFLIAAAHKSSGKTVISTGLAAALTAQGHTVQCFKKGPDYIDPMWLSTASGRPCYNLDFNTLTTDEISQLLAEKSQGAGIALIEANKGLYDGVNTDGSDSNAELAKQLNLPTILVIDCAGMTRGIAPLLIGYQVFDPDVNIAGIILNRVGGPRHEGKLRAAVTAHTDIPVIGAVANNPDLDIGERHLGLTTPAETGALDQMIRRFGDIIGQSVDLELLAKIASTAPPLAAVKPKATNPIFTGLKIGIPRDASFGFYYPDDLEAFISQGADLVFFDAINAPSLPEIDGLFIGGGFPEMNMAALAANTALRTDIKNAIQAGLPTYAECGGLMYLCAAITWGEKQYPMCDVIDGNAIMQKRPQGRGYTRFSDTTDHPWGLAAQAFPAHEFHYARIDDLGDNTLFGREILRGHGTNGKQDGIVIHNLLAGFCHLRNTQTNPWVSNFLQFVADKKQPEN